MESIAVNGKQVLETKTAIIDSGIRFLISDTEAVRQLMITVEGAKDATETIGPGFWSSSFSIYSETGIFADPLSQFHVTIPQPSV